MTEIKGDLISREWLKDAFDNLCSHACKTCRNFRNEDSFYKCNLIENAPTVERPHGEWRHYEGVLTCSNCNSEFYDDIMEYVGDDVPKFCPDCGSSMRKEGEAE